MKLFILSDPSSIHTKRWVSSLSQKGIEIFLFGVNHTDDEFYKKYSNVTVYAVNITSNFKGTSLRKLKYLTVLVTLKKKIKEFQPDALHAHYASSYGFLGALAGFHPYFISVWGSDVYDFPKISFFYRAILKYNLSKADCVLSTSKIMAKETNKYTCKRIEITPFGVDLNKFKKEDNFKHKNEFIVGTVKTLSSVYRIDLLIKSFKLVLEKNPNVNLRLQIIGDGPDKDKLQLLTNALSIDKYVDFLGMVENNQLPNYYNNFSIFVALSDSESFGVVAVESMACECPVIVSNADGFMEVVVDKETGYIVPKGDIELTANAIQQFVDDGSLRERMGRKGRDRVESLYDWDKNVETMIHIYNTIINNIVN